MSGHTLTAAPLVRRVTTPSVSASADAIAAANPFGARPATPNNPASPWRQPGKGAAHTEAAIPVRDKAHPTSEETTVRECRQPPATTALAAMASAPPAKSKVDKALSYLRLHGTATSKELSIAMGLDPRENSASQFIGHVVRKGGIERVGKLYRLGASEAPVTAEPSMAPIPALAHDPIHAPAHYTAGGLEVIDILRAKLTPEEFRGFCKGNIIKYTLRANFKGGAADYAKADVYAGWLVAATAEGSTRV